MSTDNLLGDDNPLNVDNLFIPEAPPIPLEGIPQGRTPMDRVGEAAMKIAPYLIPGVTPLMATMNAIGVTNAPLISQIMKNAPGLGLGGEEAGPEWEVGPRGEAARAALAQQGGLGDYGYGLGSEVY